MWSAWLDYRRSIAAFLRSSEFKLLLEELEKPTLAVEEEHVRIGMPELLVVLVIILIIFGAGKLPEIGSGIGRGIKNFKKATKRIPKKIPSPEKTDEKAKKEA